LRRLPQKKNFWDNRYYYCICLTAFFARTTWVSRHLKGKPSWILLEQQLMGGSGISWTICKSFAPRSRQKTTPVPHHSVFTGRIPFLPPNQQHQTTEGKFLVIYFPNSLFQHFDGTEDL